MQSGTHKLVAEKDGAIGRLTINNPERRNAFSFAMWQALPGILEDFWADAEIRIVILRGAGGQAFSAGNDISEFKQRRSSKQGIAEYDAATYRAYDALISIDKPTIAMIEGFCIGGGLELALLCDIQIAADSARFAVTPARLGLGYKYEDMRLLVNNVGPKFAKEILFTGRQFSADEACQMGIVNRVVPAQGLAQAIEEYAQTIAANAPLSVKAAKRIVTEATKETGQADLDLCQRLVDACHASEDYKEGQRAFTEKRKPIFTGR
ncbi:MAG: enoyl-CoA hydratase [Gammaproteobacteria bacterium]|nr:MAG: enoyl-CoA hydratase [Gammaproteobacteria bacterium]